MPKSQINTILTNVKHVILVTSHRQQNVYSTARAKSHFLFQIISAILGAVKASPALKDPPCGLDDGRVLLGSTTGVVRIWERLVQRGSTMRGRY